MTIALSLAAWVLIGILAAWFGKYMGRDHLGWLGVGSLALAGAVAGGFVGLAVTGAFYGGVIGSAIGGVGGALLRGAAEEIRKPGPGMAV